MCLANCVTWLWTKEQPKHTSTSNWEASICNNETCVQLKKKTLNAGLLISKNLITWFSPTKMFYSTSSYQFGSCHYWLYIFSVCCSWRHETFALDHWNTAHNEGLWKEPYSQVMEHWDLAAIQTLPAYTCNYWVTWHMGDFRACCWKEKLGKRILSKSAATWHRIVELVLEWTITKQTLREIYTFSTAFCMLILNRKMQDFMGEKKKLFGWMNEWRHINLDHLRGQNRWKGSRLILAF